MGADAQRLHQGQLLQGEDVGSKQFSGGERQDVPHAAVHVDAQDVQVRAAVRLAHAAGHAVAAVHVGHDGALVAGMDLVHVPARRDDFHAQFVPEDAGIVEKGLRALVGMEVRAADPDPAYLHQGLAGARRRGLRRALQDETAGFFEYDGGHGVRSRFSREQGGQQGRLAPELLDVRFVGGQKPQSHLGFVFRRDGFQPVVEEGIPEPFDAG